MAITVTIRDETAAGGLVHEVPLAFPGERITVRELIRERVYQEVQDFNRREQERVFRGLVQPTDTQRMLEGGRPEYRMERHRSIEWRPQYEKAVEAFSRNGFLVLVDDRQAAALDEAFTVTPTTRIAFVKLTMLVGG